MIGIRVYGAAKVWFARVDKRRAGASWVKVPIEKGPEVKSVSADYAVLRAITAFERAARRAFECERCGHCWNMREGRTKAPKKCPTCRRPWRYKRRPVKVGTVVPETGSAGNLEHLAGVVAESDARMDAIVATWPGVKGTTIPPSEVGNDEGVVEGDREPGRDPDTEDR